MNLESILNVTKFKTELNNSSNEDELRYKLNLKEDTKKRYNELEIFKKLLPDSSSINAFVEMKDYLILKCLMSKVETCGVSGDYVKGYNNALITILQLRQEFDELHQELLKGV